MSQHAFGSDWAELESQTFRYRDPLNKARRFIPLRLDDAPVPGSLAQFLFVDWSSPEQEEEFQKLLESCQQFGIVRPAVLSKIRLQVSPPVVTHNFGNDGKSVISGFDDGQIALSDAITGKMTRKFEGHTDLVESVCWPSGQDYASTASDDDTIRIWDLRSGECAHVLIGHDGQVMATSLSDDCSFLLSCSGMERSIYCWDVESETITNKLLGHRGGITCVELNRDNTMALSSGLDGSVRVWDLDRGECISTLHGHTDDVWCVKWMRDERYVLSGSSDYTIRLWDRTSSSCIRILEGHTNRVPYIALHKDQQHVLSAEYGNRACLFDISSGDDLATVTLGRSKIVGISWSKDGSFAKIGDETGDIWSWDLRDFLDSSGRANRIERNQHRVEEVQYTNAKVLLVGNTSAGKTGLSNRLAHGTYSETDSTVGAWSTRWPLEVQSDDDVQREIWLWDFGGQADQRLIHQLYMDQTHVAVLVFDPQKQELLEGLASWDRDLTRAATGDFQKLLVAGRIDAGGLRSVSRRQVNEFACENGFADYLETSAKEETGCEALQQKIAELIDWEGIAKRTSPALFRRLKKEIIALKDEGRILMRFNEMREALTLRMGGESFTDDELKTVISLLGGPGVVWELGFGSWVLLSPEMINAYAQAVIRTIQQDEGELGCIKEECVLAGKLSFPQELKRLPEEEERILLLDMHRLLVENNLCLDEETEAGTLLVFPSYARRERPDLIEYPSVLVSYQFEGFLDDIYATLVVRLHRTGPFEMTDVWNGAADFTSIDGKKLGVKLVRKSAGKAELLVYFDPDLPVGERMIFSRYVQEHLFRKVKSRDEVKRLRHWICEKCSEPVENRERAMQRLRDNGTDAKIICVNCEKHVKLWDEMEEAFADPEITRRVRELEAAAQSKLDNESKERALVGDVISTVALAGQLSREFNVSDHGLDMEIEFKDDEGQATGQRLYLQLKSGESYLSKRKRDGVDIFRIPKPRHVKYWMDQAYPVMVVIRNAAGEIQWMEVREYLRNATNGGKKQVRQIEYNGERFDVMSVRRWRDRMLSLKN